MSLVVSGVSHHTCPVELRERLAIPQEALPGALIHLQKQLDGAGVVILSTCNRVEFYVHSRHDADHVKEQIRQFIEEAQQVPSTEFAETLYEYEGREAVGHLFRVTSSLDSLVVGENQIQGQVHDAFLLAQSEQTTDKVIHALFQRAFSTAKKVKTQSTIGQGKVSISSVAVDLAVSIFMELADKTAMVVGSGEMGELTLKSLVQRGVGHVVVANRSVDKAEALAAQYNGEAIALDTLDAHLPSADIVITSTGAPSFILTPDHFRAALKARSQSPMFVIDIAVPRDVDPAVGQLDDVYCYDVDDLKEVADANMETRREELEHCMAFVDNAVDKFINWTKSLAAEPALVSMAEELNVIRERELAKTLAALPELTDKEREEVAYMSRRLVKAILQRPMSGIKKEIAHHDPHTVLHLVKRLFGLEEN